MENKIMDGIAFEYVGFGDFSGANAENIETHFDLYANEDCSKALIVRGEEAGISEDPAWIFAIEALKGRNNARQAYRESPAIEA